MPDRRTNTALRGQQSSAGRANETIAELAARQEGNFARFQVRPLGVSDKVIVQRLSCGMAFKRHDGVYSWGTPNRSPRGKWWAAVLAGGPGAVLARRACAVMWGVRKGDPGVIDVITPTRRKAQAGLRFHPEALPADEITDELGIPATVPVRTAFDLAGVLQPHQVESVINEIEIQQL